MNDTAEQKRLNEARLQKIPWKKWGLYLSKRQRGTVREDYSHNGDAWNYFTHDQARSRAYRWFEDGLAGISDLKQHLRLVLGSWKREGPYPQGVPLRPHQRRGQPRKGCEGVLFLCRQHADASDSFKIKGPTGSGIMMNLFEVSREIANRLTNIFLVDGQGKRSVFGGAEKFRSDSDWRDRTLFYEYFHGDNGSGLGASDQTGRTGLVAKLIQLYGFLDPQRIPEKRRGAMFAPGGGKGEI